MDDAAVVQLTSDHGEIDQQHPGQRQRSEEAEEREATLVGDAPPEVCEGHAPLLQAVQCHEQT